MNNKTIKSIDEYIGAFPPDIQKILTQIRQIIQKEAPNVEESIAYGMTAYKINGKPLVYFAVFKNHIGLYPTPQGIEFFNKELSKYKHAKGSVQFPINEPIPLDLINKIVKFRAQETHKSL